MAKSLEEQQDHVDRFLASIRDELPPDLDLTVEGIVDRISGLNRRLKKMMTDTLAEFDLTWGEWKVLGHLLHQGRPYRMSPGKLAENLELSSGAMTNRLDQLEEAGLIRRLPDPTDRRSVQVELTPAGQKAYRQPTAAAAAKEALVVSALNEREREQLNGFLRRMMIAFEDLHPHA
jgi:DNA-binding MarR family transcriptional regulator